MKFDWKDLIPLRWPLLLLVVCVAFSATLINYASSKQSVVVERIRVARIGANEAKQKFQDSDQEKATISQYLPEYRKLQERGFIGSENRLKWIGALRNADRNTARFGVQYELGAQGAYKGPLSNEPIASQLRQSTMEIRLGVVHEGQFLSFIDALAAQDVATYTLRTCSLEPTHGGKPQPRTQNLNAQCQIDWITMVRPEKDDSR